MLSDEDKTFLIETVGNIVGAATTGIQQDLTLLKQGQAELSQDVLLLKQGLSDLRDEISVSFKEVEEHFIDVEGDIKGIKRHVAALSHDAMVAKPRQIREQKATDERLTAVEAVVQELKARIKNDSP